jgi:hypothetical protein
MDCGIGTQHAERRHKKNQFDRTVISPKPMSEVGHERPIGGVHVMSAFASIVLQNSFLGCVQIFSEALVRSLENYVGVT